eukprot:6380042-Alexandrium_andersonii.AAC.2
MENPSHAKEQDAGAQSKESLMSLWVKTESPCGSTMHPPVGSPLATNGTVLQRAVAEQKPWDTHRSPSRVPVGSVQVSWPERRVKVGGKSPALLSQSCLCYFLMTMAMNSGGTGRPKRVIEPA